MNNTVCLRALGSYADTSAFGVVLNTKIVFQQSSLLP